jgi:hypothetical protein
MAIATEKAKAVIVIDLYMLISLCVTSRCTAYANTHIQRDAMSQHRALLKRNVSLTVARAKRLGDAVTRGILQAVQIMLRLLVTVATVFSGWRDVCSPLLAIVFARRRTE